MNPKLKAPGTERFTLRCDEPLSSFAFKFNLRRYIKVECVPDGVTRSVPPPPVRRNASGASGSGAGHVNIDIRQSPRHSHFALVPSRVPGESLVPPYACGSVPLSRTSTAELPVVSLPRPLELSQLETPTYLDLSYRGGVLGPACCDAKANPSFNMVGLRRFMFPFSIPRLAGDMRLRVLAGVVSIMLATSPIALQNHAHPVIHQN